MANLKMMEFPGDEDFAYNTCEVLEITKIRFIPLSENTSLLSLVFDEDVHIEFGTDPRATNKSMFLPANKIKYFSIDLETMPFLSVCCSGFTPRSTASSSKMWFEA